MGQTQSPKPGSSQAGMCCSFRRAQQLKLQSSGQDGCRTSSPWKMWLSLGAVVAFLLHSPSLPQTLQNTFPTVDKRATHVFRWYALKISITVLGPSRRARTARRAAYEGPPPPPGGSMDGLPVGRGEPVSAIALASGAPAPRHSPNASCDLVVDRHVPKNAGTTVRAGTTPMHHVVAGR